MPTTVDERINISPDDFTRIPFLQNALVRLQITDVDLILFHNKIPEYVSKTKIVLYVTNNITAVPSFDYKIETVVVSIQKRTLYVPNDEFASFRRHLDLDKRLPEGVSTSENIRLFDIRDISCYKRRFPFLIQIHCLGNEIPVSSLRKLPEKLKFLLHNLKNSGYASLRITCHSFHEDFKN
ncbi:uncharacterized protein RJT20DRAFT_2637 [Scheffersomyces xylosifermentans]|uniref:uncharacterized protein n=1 Tax=Scheffersomyces xylosifermentans TaxID=1304137 RepID=UPI00315DD4EF